MQTVCDNVNTEDFISEIEQHQALWNVRQPDYSNKQIKVSAWEAVILKFYPNFANENGAQRNNIGEVTCIELTCFEYTCLFVNI